ncbi:MAG TPA: hypothetical protein VK927_03015 [Adhaeribacter sp.]|nr:hypothetical protein [Adhaeribacter sp.]
MPKNHSVFTPDYCRIYGSVYLERNPARKAGTHFSVYEEPEAAFATVAVYKETNKLFADAPGIWHLASGRNFADFVVYVEPNRNLADFSIHFTDSRSFAGCRN